VIAARWRSSAAATSSSMVSVVRIDGADLQHHGISMLMPPGRKRVITFGWTDQADRQLSIELPLRAEACVVRLHPVHPGSPAEG